MENNNVDIDINYFINNDNIHTDDFCYFMKHAFMDPYPSMNCKHTTKEIENIIMSLKSKNSSGYDEICTKILKVSSLYISWPSIIYAVKFLLWEFFLTGWNTLLYNHYIKMVTHMMCLNCRPVSLLTSFSKILKNVMHSSILRHLTKHNILSTEQCGFRTKLKTDSATYKLMTEIVHAVNNKVIVGIFCDL